MKKKTCFKCDNTKPLSEFYKHPCMGDGRLNKCKDCTKADVRAREEKKKATDPQWVLAERRRHREKSRKYRDEGRVKPLSNNRPVIPHKKEATAKLNRAIKAGKITREPCMVCGSDEGRIEAHHEDYSKPLEVHWLCVRHHNDRHIYLRECEVLGTEPDPIEKLTFVAEPQTH